MAGPLHFEAPTALEDFAALVEARRAEIAAGVARREQEKADAEDAERQRKASLLAAY